MHHKLVYIAIVLGVVLVYILIIFVGFQHFIALVVESYNSCILLDEGITLGQTNTFLMLKLILVTIFPAVPAVFLKYIKNKKAGLGQ